MKESFSIKLWDGIRIVTDRDTEIVDAPCDLWKVFGWDIENDPDAKECASIITRELFCFGRIDLSPMNGGKTLLLVAIPSKESEDAMK